MDYDLAPTSVAVGGANLFATNEEKIDMHAKTWKAFPALTSILSILTKLGDDPAHAYRQDWQEENEIPTKFVVGDEVSAAGTTLNVVANGKVLVATTVIWNPRTNDYASVDTTPTTNAVTITRDVLGSTGAIWKAQDILWAQYPLIPEDEDDQYRPVSVVADNRYNYQQLLRMQFSVTRQGNLVATHFGGPGAKRNVLQQQKYRQVRILGEQTLIGGARSSSGTAPTSYRTMGGLNHYLRSGTLYKNFNGVFTESGFNALLGDYKDQNPDSFKVMAFIAPNVLRRVRDWAVDKVRLSPESTTYGIDIHRYKASGMEVDLVPCPVMNDPETKGWGFILDLDRIMLKTLDPMKFYPDLKGMSSERIYDMYRVVHSMLLGNESRHSMFVGALV